MKIVMKIALLLGIVALAACTTGRTAFDKGQELERNGKFDAAVLKYAESVSSNPEQSEYRLAFLRASEASSKQHLKSADELFNAKRYDEAYVEYESAMVMDPSQNRSKQQMEVITKHRQSQLLLAEGAAYEKENKSKEAVRSYQASLNHNPSNREAAEAVERLLKTRKVRAEGFELNLKSTKPITLKFKDAKIKDVFNIVTQLSGINFVFDEGVKDSNVTIYLENATFQQALDIICGMHKLNKKILNESTVIIYPKSPDKAKQYEDLYVQTFFLNKLDAKKAVNLIRTMLQVKKIYVNEEMNTLVLRDTADVIEVARRILEANDVPDAEVVLEVEVIEVSKKNAESFGLALSRYAVDLNLTGPSGKFLNSNFVSTDATTTTGSSTVDPTTGQTINAAATLTKSDTSQLVNLFRWGDYNGYITVPSATFNFGKTLGNAETLSNPKMRVKNREKAKFNVGTRVPITTTTTNGNVGGYSVNVQYVDVGVKLNVEPTIQLNNDVNIKLSLEVSSILAREKIGSDNSTTIVTIGTRNIDTVLTLRDGETSVIGGLIQDTKSNNTQKVSILGEIPVIGQLFSNKENSGDKTELILAITPRLVRGITVSDPEIASFWSGLEDDPSLASNYESFTQEPEFPTPTAKAPPVPPAVPMPLQTAPQPKPLNPVQPAAIDTAPQLPPVVPVVEPNPLADSSQQPVNPFENVQAVPPDPATPAASQPKTPVDPPVTVPPPQARRVALSVSAPSVVKLNQPFTADIMVSEANNLFSAPLKVVYDPALLEALTITEGDFFNKDGKPSNFTSAIEPANGIVDARFFREANTGGISGSGRLFSISFRAKAQGIASIGFTAIKLAGQGYKPVESTPYNTVIEVKQP